MHTKPEWQKPEELNNNNYTMEVWLYSVLSTSSAHGHFKGLFLQIYVHWPKYLDPISCFWLIYEHWTITRPLTFQISGWKYTQHLIRVPLWLKYSELTLRKAWRIPWAMCRLFQPGSSHPDLVFRVQFIIFASSEVKYSNTWKTRGVWGWGKFCPRC